LARCITMNESTCSVSSSVRAAVVATFTADATRDCSRSPLESRLTDTAAAVEAAVAHNTCRGDRVSREWIMHDRAARALYPALWIARETRLDAKWPCRTGPCAPMCVEQQRREGLVERVLMGGVASMRVAHSRLVSLGMIRTVQGTGLPAVGADA